eukprot:scaffold87951_cov16-Tisochrysis_lutea.AAC.2
MNILVLLCKGLWNYKRNAGAAEFLKNAGPCPKCKSENTFYKHYGLDLVNLYPVVKNIACISSVAIWYQLSCKNALSPIFSSSSKCKPKQGKMRLAGTHEVDSEANQAAWYPYALLCAQLSDSQKMTKAPAHWVLDVHKAGYESNTCRC